MNIIFEVAPNALEALLIARAMTDAGADVFSISCEVTFTDNKEYQVWAKVKNEKQFWLKRRKTQS